MSKNDNSCPTPEKPYPSDCEITAGLRARSQAREAIDERGYAWRACFPKAKAIRLLLLDVDGILTDGTIVYTDDGNEIKSFHTRDGLGIRLLQETGVQVGLITARQSKVVSRRAEDLKLSLVYQKVTNKVEVYERLLHEMNLQAHEVAYMGDDWLDLALLTRVGFSATVADAVVEVRNRVHYITRKPGGQGAVRELCDLIMEAKGTHEILLARYLEG